MVPTGYGTSWSAKQGKRKSNKTALSMVVAVCSWPTWHCVPEASNLHGHHYENLKSKKLD
jgi:hypothetical protein